VDRSLQINFRVADQPSTMLGPAASLYGCRLVMASSQFTIAACIAIRWSENGWSVRMRCSVTLVLPAFLKASTNAWLSEVLRSSASRTSMGPLLQKRDTVYVIPFRAVAINFIYQLLGSGANQA